MQDRIILFILQNFIEHLRGRYISLEAIEIVFDGFHASLYNHFHYQF